MVDQQELSSAGLKFMDFAIRFFNMAKCQYQQQNQVKANKAGFQVLFILSMPEYTPSHRRKKRDKISFSRILSAEYFGIEQRRAAYHVRLCQANEHNKAAADKAGE